MIWNPFKKKNIDPERNRIDELANSLNESGKIESLEDELIKLKLNRLNDKEIEAWHHLYGICAFQRGDHAEAAKRFKNGLVKCPNSPQIKFSLAQEYIYLGQPSKTFSLFDECVFPAVSRDFALAMSRYAYLYSEFTRGIKYLERFIDIYKEIKVLDDHFLYVRGMPFFGTVWSSLAAHCVLSGNEEKLKQVTNDISQVCHDYDFDFLNMELDAILSENYTNLIPTLMNRLKEIEAYNGPTGYTYVKKAVYESFNVGTFQESISAIDQVGLDGNDFPWLEDIKLLSKAKAANRFGEQQAEDEFINQFIANQPLLFEPEHAVSFGLIRYQELLKSKVPLLSAYK